MGNGAAVPLKEKRRITESEYSQLEKLCKNGYFYEHFDEYQMRVQQAIRWDALDCLELLIMAGDVKKLQPLHVAAKLGKLESVEILLSAGFSAESVDKDGRTPLHLCTFIHTEEAALCACLIGLWYPRTVDRYDRAGYLPIHLAAINDNVSLATALYKMSPECVGKTSTSGKSLYELAKEHNSTLVMKWWKDRKNTNTTSSPNKSTKVHDQVSSERIMEVWERFFENAFKRAGVDYDEEDDMDYPPPAPEYTHNKKKSSSSKHTSKVALSSKKSTPSSSSKMHSFAYEELNDVDYEEYLYAKHKQSIKATMESTNSAKRITTTPQSHKKQANTNTQKKKIDLWDEFEDEDEEDYNSGHYQDNYGGSGNKRYPSGKIYYDHDIKATATVDTPTDYIFDWFQWIVYYDEPQGDYLVIHLQSKECQWLQDFLDSLRVWSSSSYDFLHYSYDEVMTWPQPSNLLTLLHSGWMIYYDLLQNYYLWINVVTTSFEQYLPLGWEEYSETLTYYGLLRFDDSLEWVAPDSTMSRYWVQVMMESPENDRKGYTQEEDGEGRCYYLHRLTGYTTWYPPSDWEKIIAEYWDHWICCCMESNPDALFWYDPYSGTSCWVEE